jgi:hypothetical protein
MDDIVHLVFWLEIETNTVEIPPPTQTPCDAAKSRSEFLQDVLGASSVVVAHGSAEEQPATVAERPPRVAKVEEGKIGLRRNEQRQLASGPGERTTLVRGCLPVLFHVGVLNVERAIGRASDVDSYDDKRKHRSCWTLFAKIE